jgi:hypothetical protein
MINKTVNYIVFLSLIFYSANTFCQEEQATTQAIENSFKGKGKLSVKKTIEYNLEIDQDETSYSKDPETQALMDELSQILIDLELKTNDDEQDEQSNDEPTESLGKAYEKDLFNFVSDDLDDQEKMISPAEMRIKIFRAMIDLANKDRAKNGLPALQYQDPEAVEFMKAVDDFMSPEEYIE